MATYLDFENKIEKIQEEIVSAHAIANMDTVKKLQKELEKEVNKTFGSLSDFQKLQLARHPDRPYALDYIKLLMEDAYEIHGDRAFRDDPAILCYIGWIDGQKTMLIGEQKGRGVKIKSNVTLVCQILKDIEKLCVQSKWQRNLTFQYSCL